MKRVSVIVPVYNTARYLDRCIESIKSQTYGNLEILFVDDGSTDESLKILEKYRKTDRRIRIISKSNTGQSDSRFVAFSKSSGDYIYCVDSDDTIESNAIELLVSGLEEYGCDMFFARLRLINENGDILKTTRKYDVELLTGRREIVSDALCANNIKASLCIKICRRELWEKYYSNEVRNIKFNEDYFLTILFSMGACSVGFSNQIIYNALQRRGSVSRNVRKEILLSHDIYFPIISMYITRTLPGLDLQRSCYLGYAKNLYLSFFILATEVSDFRGFIEIYRLLDSKSIFKSERFSSCIRKVSLSYRILDSLVRYPSLFYRVAKMLSFRLKY